MQRQDNGVVLHNRVVVDGEVVKFESWDQLSLPWIDYNHEREDRLIIVAIDQAWNVVEQEVSLQIAIPSLSLEDIQYTSDSARIISELSTTIDRGQVKFQRNRHWYWEPLDPEEFSIKPLNPEVIWETYDTTDGLESSDWSEDDNSQNESDTDIDTQQDSESQFDPTTESEDTQTDSETNSQHWDDWLPSSMGLSCSWWSPVAQFEDDVWNMFWVLLEPDTGDRIETPEVWSPYEVVVLWTDEWLWVYSNGWCVRRVGMQSCIMYISVYGHTLIEEPYRYWMQWHVELDEETMAATMQLEDNDTIIVTFTFDYLPF